MPTRHMLKPLIRHFDPCDSETSITGSRILPFLVRSSILASVLTFLSIHDAFDMSRFSDYISTRTDFVVLDHHSCETFSVHLHPADRNHPRLCIWGCCIAADECESADFHINTRRWISFGSDDFRRIRGTTQYYHRRILLRIVESSSRELHRPCRRSSSLLLWAVGELYQCDRRIQLLE